MIHEASQTAQDSVEMTERLALVQALWLGAAHRLNLSPPGTPARTIAQKVYVVATRARVEWEADYGGELPPHVLADRMNTLFDEGLERAAETQELRATVTMQYDYAAWSDYMHWKIFPSVRCRDERPANYYELAMQLETGQATFS